MASVPNPANIRYGGFYIPIFSLLYIYQEIGLPVEFQLPIFTLVLNESNFGWWIGLTLLGALVGHGMSRSIYGIEGAKSNPKNRWAVFWYRNLFLVKRDPGLPPQSFGDVKERFQASVENFNRLSNPKKLLVVLVRSLRAIVLSSVRFVFLGVVFITTAVIAISAVEATIQPLGTVLLVAQVIFFFGGWVFGRFPTAVPLDAVPWLYLAEYQKAEYSRQQGNVDFEYGPVDSPSQQIQSAADEFNEEYQAVRNLPQYHDSDEIDWTVPIEEPDPEYLIELDDESDTGDE